MESQVDIDVNAVDNEKFTPLHHAATRGNVGDIENLVRRGADINALGDDNLTPLHNATLTGKVDAIKKLIGLGANIEAGSTYNLTPLHYASLAGQEDIVKLLVNLGADINSKDNDNSTPLHYSLSESSSFKTIKMLLSLGADIDSRDNGNSTPFHHTLSNGNIDVIKEFVRHDANLEERDANGHTYIIRAAIMGDTNSAQILIESGANLNSMDSRGVTAFTHATRGLPKTNPEKELDHWNTAKFLAEHGANGHEGYTRFPRLMDYRLGGDKKRNDLLSEKLHLNIHDSDKIASLVLKGVDVDSYRDGQTALINACSLNLLETVKVLVGAGASMKKRGLHGYTPIITASSHGNTDIVKFLIEKGADITSKTDAKSNKGYNSLMLACFNGHIETVEILIDRGSDLDEIDPGGNTSMHISLVQNNTSIVELLIQKGARVNFRNSDGISPLMLATALEKLDVVEMLIKEGGATIDVDSLTLGKRLREESPDLNATFSQHDLMKSTIPRTGITGKCLNVDSIMLKDGRCVQMTHDEARHSMMRILNAQIDPTRVILPVQISGTCWFFTTVAVLFVSDMTRENTKDLRRSMIMGRKTVGGEKFAEPLYKTLLNFNVMIQTILDGNRNDPKDSIMPIINNEEVVLGLNENGAARVGLNCGSNPIDFIEDLIKSISILKDNSVWGFLHNDNLYIDVFIASFIADSTFDNTVVEGSSLTKIINDDLYVADAITMSKNDHVISGLTLGGERYIYDSNIGVIHMDWGKFFDNVDFIFEINGKEYSFRTSAIVIFYNKKQ